MVENCARCTNAHSSGSCTNIGKIATYRVSFVYRVSFSLFLSGSDAARFASNPSVGFNGIAVQGVREAGRNFAREILCII